MRRRSIRRGLTKVLALLLALAPCRAAENLPLSTRTIIRKHQITARKERERFQLALQEIQIALLKDLDVEFKRLTDLKKIDAAHATSELMSRIRAEGIQNNLLTKGHILGLPTNDKFFEGEGAVTGVTSRSEVGCSLGALPQGAQVELQFVSGAWKHFGNIASASPDSGTPSEVNPNRLAIGARDPETGAIEILAIVPGGTKTAPFVWEVPGDLAEVILRINDTDGNFKSNPDKGVKYRIKITVE